MESRTSHSPSTANARPTNTFQLSDLHFRRLMARPDQTSPRRVLHALQHNHHLHRPPRSARESRRQHNTSRLPARRRGAGPINMDTAALDGSHVPGNSE